MKRKGGGGASVGTKTGEDERKKEVERTGKRDEKKGGVNKSARELTACSFFAFCQLHFLTKQRK